MPLTLPDLDDRGFHDLVEEARTLIPALAPEWTNHNIADPGITLVEMFAFLAEVLIYRLNRVTAANTVAFLRLINGPDWQMPPGADLAGEVRRTVLALRQCDRAVTMDDFAALAIAADPRVARAHCVPGRNLEASPTDAAPAHVSVAIVPSGGGDPPADLLAAVAAYLEPRRLLTTRLHVVAPRRVAVSVSVSLYLRPDALPAAVRKAAVAALNRFLDPLTGGPDGTGWPFGRAVYLSEVYSLLEQLPGVDYIAPTGGMDELTSPDAPALRRDGKDLIGLALAPDQLVAARINPAALTLVTPARH